MYFFHLLLCVVKLNKKIGRKFLMYTQNLVDFIIFVTNVVNACHKCYHFYIFATYVCCVLQIYFVHRTSYIVFRRLHRWFVEDKYPWT